LRETRLVGIGEGGLVQVRGPSCGVHEIQPETGTVEQGGEERVRSAAVAWESANLAAAAVRAALVFAAAAVERSAISPSTLG
jgi:hypothetical protein